MSASLPFTTAATAWAAPGDVAQTPTVPSELPVEVETELAPAASLKQAPLWKELIQLIEAPYAPVVRRPGFGVAMPPLNVWPLDYNFLTGQPMRLRTVDGEVSWDQPGPLFEPDELLDTTGDSVPDSLRTVIGALVASDDDVLSAGEADGSTPCTTCGFLLVSNPDGHPAIPPDGTVAAVPAMADGLLQEWDPATATSGPVAELEIPINEEDFLAGATRAEKNASRAHGEALGKALFWDMQVGSDGVQACGTCHFHAGVDNRTKNQLNPNHLGGDTTLQVRGPNEEVVASDFPFHKLEDPDVAGEPLLNPGNVLSDANDVLSSMGVRFRVFVDIPAPGPTAFVPGSNPPVLRPDVGLDEADPITVFQGLRRVEPRHTPTMHAAAFNFDNFWDGRARFHFNGGSVFGPSDPQGHVFVDEAGALASATNGYFRDDMTPGDPMFAEPVRIKFSSLGSQAVGPPLSDFEMSFAGRNWAKIGKKLLQDGVVPLANQLVDPDDSVLGRYSNQRITPGTPGLSVSYRELIELAFRSDLWANATQHLAGAPDPSDPFDGYSLTPADGPAPAADTNRFSQMEANFSLFFGLGIQLYEELLIPDDSPFDQFMDANPLAANAVGEPGALDVLYPTLVRDLVGGGVTLVPGFGEDELYGFDIFAGANLTAALPVGSRRNPDGFGSNPFARSARCSQCHFGPEQTDHSINVAHGLLKGDAEFEFPTPPTVVDPNGDVVPSAEPAGPIAAVGGLILAEEVEGTAQDAVEVEPRSFAVVDDPATPWDDRIVAPPRHFAFGDQGIYNIGLRPSADDSGRGGDDPFGWPLSMSALMLKNVAGPDFEPCDLPTDSCAMANVDPLDLGATFEESGDGGVFPGTTHTLQSINPGYERDPAVPRLPSYMVPWTNGLPAGELHPQIDEMAFAPNVVTPPNGGPAVEFTEYLFGDDLHCGTYDPAVFGAGPPSFGWGATDPVTGELVDSCPNNQSGVSSNLAYPQHGTWPVPNRVLRQGAFKAPALRNVELTGPYFHTGSYLTLRQVVDFYMRGGDFPVTNGEHRDPHIFDLELQAFGFGRTRGADLAPFADALPDPAYQYGPMPDTTHPLTPEPATSTAEEAKVALVKFLIALTDARVKFERAPFDRPEIFVPLDGAAPDNDGGRAALLTDSRFLRVAAVGGAGRADALTGFLGTTSVAGSGLDHFDRQPAPPVAADLSFVAFAGLTLRVRAPGVLAAASDINDEPLTATLVSGPADPDARLTLTADGSFTYVHLTDVDAPVVDAFQYRVSDGTYTSDVATITVKVVPRPPTLVDVHDEPTGPNCPYGGKRVDSGLDYDLDGVLDVCEVSETSYECNAPPRTCVVRVTPEPPGHHCPAGGERVDSGLDDDYDGVLDDTEVDRTSYLCADASPKQTLVAVTPVAAGECANGGERIATGLDLDGDGALQASEETSVSVVCAPAHGEPAGGSSGSVSGHDRRDDDGHGGGCRAAPGQADASWALLLLLGLMLLRRRPRRS